VTDPAQARDYVAWHTDYDDPDSDLSWRLHRVQDYLRTALDASTGRVTAVSVCAGDGRDLLEVLADRADRHRVAVFLLELHPVLAQRARDRAAEIGLPEVEVRTVDAGTTDSYTGIVPADLLLLVGIFGNISDEDVEQTIRMTPQLCRPGATVLWSRSHDLSDRNARIRQWFAEVGCEELDYAELPGERRPALGAMRFDGETEPLEPGEHLFTFYR
jgi:hypothetical protein